MTSISRSDQVRTFTPDDRSDLPRPQVNERPTNYADRVGEWYVAQKTDIHRKEYGLYLTPITMAKLMGGGFRASGKKLRLLDPAAGAGILLCAAVESVLAERGRPEALDIVAYELDQQLIPPLRTVLDYLSEWCKQAYGTSLRARIHASDFVLAHAEALRLFGTLLPYQSGEELFDLVISNPPYFKISRNDPRAVAAASVVHGQPNIYGLFMAVGAAMLKPQGDFIYVVPRSFSSGPYFCRFRSVFFKMICPTHVHVFDSRRDPFNRDDILQENVILFGTKEERWHQEEMHGQLTLSSSQGVGDIGSSNQHLTPIKVALDLESKNKVLRLPLNSEDDAALAIVDSWPNRLDSFGLNISTGPVVPFRARDVVDEEGHVCATHVPLLWMNHVSALEVRWPLNKHKREYIRRAGSEPLLLPNKNYVLLRRFSAKEEVRRLTATPYIAANFGIPEIGLENHLNYVHRPGGTLDEDEAWGLAGLYNSRLLNTYFRAANGNTQVSATELRAMRLPPKHMITSLGEKLKRASEPLQELDHLIFRYILSTRIMEKAVG